jgi:hypothetical protein
MTGDPLHAVAHSDPTLAEAAAVARADWRAEEESWTAEALAHWWHRRTLLECARDHLHRGDVLQVTVGVAPVAAPFSGPLVGVGSDMLVMEVDGRRVDLHVREGSPVAWRVVRRARSGGTRGLDVGSFRARLLELEMREGDVELGVALAEGACVGRLTVGRDHVAVVDPVDDLTQVISLAAVWWVRPALAG